LKIKNDYTYGRRKFKAKKVYFFTDKAHLCGLLEMSVSSTSTCRVMLVDDHELTRYTLQITLARSACIEIVAVASNGKEAIAKVREFQPDVIILDMHMPVMDGWEASHYIKSYFPDTKIIAYSSDKAGTLAKDMAAIDAFCEKGESIQNLIGLINDLK
jgi:two-component system, NarL family, vancomycin resistance associated response regulator VraR